MQSAGILWAHGAALGPPPRRRGVDRGSQCGGSSWRPPRASAYAQHATAQCGALANTPFAIVRGGGGEQRKVLGAVLACTRDEQGAACRVLGRSSSAEEDVRPQGAAAAATAGGGRRATQCVCGVWLPLCTGSQRGSRGAGRAGAGGGPRPRTLGSGPALRRARQRRRRRPARGRSAVATKLSPGSSGIRGGSFGPRRARHGTGLQAWPPGCSAGGVRASRRQASPPPQRFSLRLAGRAGARRPNGLGSTAAAGRPAQTNRRINADLQRASSSWSGAAQRGAARRSGRQSSSSSSPAAAGRPPKWRQHSDT